MRPLALLLASLLTVSAQAQDNHVIPEAPRIPERLWNPRYITPQPIYRQPIQQPGPWYTVDPSNDPWRFIGASPLPTSPLGTVRYWNGHGWSQPYWYQPTPALPRCYCY